MKDQKADDKNSQNDQKPGQPAVNTNKPSPEIKAGHNDKTNTRRLRAGEDQNFRSSNNETLGIP